MNNKIKKLQKKFTKLKSSQKVPEIGPIRKNLAKDSLRQPRVGQLNPSVSIFPLMTPHQGPFRL